MNMNNTAGKKALVCGAGGFIGGPLGKQLKTGGVWGGGGRRKSHGFGESPADEFILGDLRNQDVARDAVNGIDDVYQLAADMGGAGYIFTGDHDAEVMHNSATIDLNVLDAG